MDTVTFMGHKITKRGLEVDEEKVRALQDFQTPEDITQLRSFLGLVNFVSKFVPNSAKILYPLNNLLKEDVEWTWSSAQEETFNKIKQEIAKAAVLCYYDPTKELILQNDASEYGIGSALMQNNKPIAFASRSLTPAERNYAQIEKELLAILFGLQKFHYYVYGRNVKIETDHKSLVNISNKPLSKAPKRLQSMFLKIGDYNYELTYVPGPAIPVADALSRLPLKNAEEIHAVSNFLHTPFKENQLDEIRRETEKDSTLQALKSVISNGWPDDKDLVDPVVRIYFRYRDELTVENGVCFRSDRIIIPKSMRPEMKTKVHAGHTGVNSCLRRARQYIYWPGMSAEIRLFVAACTICASIQPKQNKQPSKLSDIPVRPWQKVGSDIFTIKSRNYLITVDYYSQFFEVDYLIDTLSETVIQKLKANFARHGIPETLITDNGPQYTSSDFIKFCKKWNIHHDTSSPGHSESNGEAESAVKIAKNMMKKCNLEHEDPYIALLNLRNTPQEGTNYTPVQRLMGRHTRTLIPTRAKILEPPFANEYRDKAEDMKSKIGLKQMNRRELPPLHVNDNVHIQPIGSSKDLWQPATVTHQRSPKSYVVKTPENKELRRNRSQLRLYKSPQQMTEEIAVQTASTKSPIRVENPETTVCSVCWK